MTVRTKRSVPMKSLQSRLFLTLGLAASTALFAQAQRTAPIILEGGRVIVGDGRVIENGAIVIDNGKLAAVGRMGDVKAPAGAKHVDVTGKSVMPTLIDAHMHMGYENMQSWRAENYTRENIIDTLD